MRNVAALCGLAVLALASVAGAQSGVALQVALDKPVELEADGMPIGQVFQRLGDLTGVKFVIDPEVYACLPYGELTGLKVKLPSGSLRENLSPMLALVAMEWGVHGEGVRITPAPALMRMTRRATKEELAVLGRILSVKMQPTAAAGSVIDQLRKATGDADLKLFFHGVEEIAVLSARAERVLPATTATWLDMFCHGKGLTWYLWGDDIMIVDQVRQIQRQLQRQVSVRHEKAPLVDVLLDLARQAHVKLTMAPGVMSQVSVETRNNFNLIMAEATIDQALEVISGATGLVFIRESDGIRVEASNAPPPAAEADRKRPPFYLKRSMTLPDGSSAELIIPADDLPEDVVEAIKAQREKFFQELIRQYRPATQPAATQPAG